MVHETGICFGFNGRFDVIVSPSYTIVKANWQKALVASLSTNESCNSPKDIVYDELIWTRFKGY